MQVAYLFALAAVCAACTPRPASVAQDTTEAGLSVERTEFRLTTDDGRVLASKDLIGAVFDMETEEGVAAKVRLDAVEPAKERPSVLLHRLTKVDDGQPLCGPDPQGRRSAVAIQGRFDDAGRFVADPSAWILSCSLGTNAKCLLWGYDPWANGPDGRSLRPYYEACQRLARADYDGAGEAHTKPGTEIDVWDDIGVQSPTGDQKYAFEAGWGPSGATCVARTRWPDLLGLEELHARAPRLAVRCGEAEARSQGAILFTAIKPRGAA